MRNSTRCMPALLICSTLLLAACGQQLPAWHSGKLVIVVPEIEQGAEAEFERELAQLFAGQLHATLETVPLPQDKISAALTGHQAHLAAASLRSEINNTGLQFGPSYQSVRELLVCNRDSSSLAELADLKGKELAVVAGSAQEAPPHPGKTSLIRKKRNWRGGRARLRRGPCTKRRKLCRH